MSYCVDIVYINFILVWSHTAAMFASRLQWTMRRNVRKRKMYTSTSKKMHVEYVATLPLHCFNYFCTLTETSQYTWLAHFGLLTYTCYVYERSVILFIVDEKQTWPRCGITPSYSHFCPFQKYSHWITFRNFRCHLSRWFFLFWCSGANTLC